MDSTGRAWGTLLRVAEPHLKAAVASVRETGFVAVVDNGRIRYLNKVLPDREIRYDRDIGQTRDISDVASGIVILAHSTQEQLAALLAGSTGDRTALEAAMERARRDGVYSNRQGLVDGAAGVAAPILNADGQPVAAVNLAGPRDRVVAQLDALKTTAVQTVARIREELLRRNRT
nr:IclR family transcriptional regulator C-terminal domain-containing protein [Aureimonas altamirensis]